MPQPQDPTSSTTSTMLTALLLLFALSACSSDSKLDGDSPDAGDDSVALAACNAHPPVLFVHGGFGSGDQFALQAQRLASNGYCESHIRTFDYDSQANTGSTTIETLQRLDAAVDSLLADTGAERIHMLGHSLGCSVSRDYLSTAAHSAKVARYVNVAGAEWTFPDDVEVLGLSSEGDEIIGRVQYAGADNPPMPFLDHIA